MQKTFHIKAEEQRTCSGHEKRVQIINIIHMLYLIGGAARSGKTNLSKRLLTGKSIPYFCIDYLVSAIDRTLHNKPSFRISMYQMISQKR
jgi:hypothetical protein